MADNAAKAAPQGKKDSDMPPPPPRTHGQVGPSPSDEAIDSAISAGQHPLPSGGESSTGEEEDPGVANAGGTGVGDANTNGAARTGLDPS